MVGCLFGFANNWRSVEHNGNSTTSDPQQWLGGVGAACQCLSKEVPRASRSVVFSGLDPGEWYFPMVVRKGEHSFYGMPPKAVQPIAQKPDDHIRSMPQADLQSIPISSHDNAYHSDDEGANGSTANIEEQHSQFNATSGLEISLQNRAQWEKEQEREWSRWVKENFQSSFDQFFCSRDSCASSQNPSSNTPMLTSKFFF